MARRPIVPFRTTKIGRYKRIKVPQHPDRPIKLNEKDLVDRSQLNKDPWWYTMHRRGVRRLDVGEDPLEVRAVPHSQVRGFLHERIEYRWLVTRLRLVPGIDFTFQSSQEGGRLELGGLVADFLFPIIRIVIQVQGPTHMSQFQEAKDSEQRSILEEMGFQVFYLDIKTIEDEMQLEEWNRRIFALAGHLGGGGGTYEAQMGVGSSLPDEESLALASLANALTVAEGLF